jgi:hypothetical protein
LATGKIEPYSCNGESNNKNIANKVSNILPVGGAVSFSEKPKDIRVGGLAEKN